MPCSRSASAALIPSPPICEKTEADVSENAKTIGMDPRTGPRFLRSGLNLCGSRFRKDIASLTYLAESLGLPEVAAYWQQVQTMDDLQRVARQEDRNSWVCVQEENGGCAGVAGAGRRDSTFV